MSLNKSKGNMYPFVTHTWNAIKGKCPHGCSYCYMKRFKQNPIRFDRKELKTDLGKDNFIFVGSSCDMWAKNVSEKWIDDTIGHCDQYSNKYLFQSKNPFRFQEYRTAFPLNTILGTTIETNWWFPEMGIAPSPAERVNIMKNLLLPTMVTIEPIIDFDLKELISLIEDCHPSWVNIGADSQGHNLPEPESGKIKELISALQELTEVKIKKNLNRLLREYPK